MRPEDRLEGKVSPSVYDRLREKWEAEKAQAKRSIEALTVARSSTGDIAAALINSGSNCEIRFKEANPKQRRDFLKAVGSNFVVMGGTYRFVSLSHSKHGLKWRTQGSI